MGTERKEMEKSTYEKCLPIFVCLCSEHHCLTLDTHHFFFFLKTNFISVFTFPFKTSNLNILNILGSEGLMNLIIV